MLANLIAAAPFRRTISFPRKRDGFHIMPTSCGQEIASGRAYDWDGFRRGSTPFSVLQHTISGEGRLRYGQRSFDLGPGDTMLVTIPHDHRYWLPRGRTWRFFWIAFSGQEALRLHRAVIDMAGPVFRLSPATLDRLAADCLHLRDGARTAGFASSLAYGATMALHDDLMSAIGTDDPSATHHADINRTVAFIKSHVAQHLDVASLAGVAGMSRAHFTRVFKRHLGMTPAEFVLRERMERAAKLLSDSRLTVKRVSIACGFKDPNYFSKAFRRTFSISPAEFRTTGMFASRSPS